jgi:acyl-CoA reductase-like NAD-dependent aldehyde dehydrogenase
MDTLNPLSPVDGKPFAERRLATAEDRERVLARAHAAQRDWARTPLDERRRLVRALVDGVLADEDSIAAELTRQMGRPIAHAPLELGGFAERGYAMVDIAATALADIELGAKEGFKRWIRREPLGTVLVLAPWNYPWLTSVNSVVPALLAGNAVVLKHSEQTPLVAERYEEVARVAGLPDGLLSHIHMTHEATAHMVGDPRVAHVAFTGSVEGGRAVQKAASERFIGVGLELGGKDPAYVRPDADLAFAADGIADGGFFNAGQSCCGIERVYVHEDVYDAFVEALVDKVRDLRLGDPTSPDTTLGPVVRESNARRIRAQVEAAVADGAKPLIDETSYAARELGPQYLAPQVLINVSHDMELMREETFGPVVGVMPVTSDGHAVELMNDSRYGLTASIWTADLEVAERLGAELDTGTVFANRSDYLDPELAWVGVKDSGRGCTLSRLGYESLTRPKSFHLRQAGS